MENEEVIREIKEMMEDRGYSLDQAIEKVARVSGMEEEEVREIYQEAE